MVYSFTSCVPFRIPSIDRWFRSIDRRCHEAHRCYRRAGPSGRCGLGAGPKLGVSVKAPRAVRNNKLHTVTVKDKNLGWAAASDVDLTVRSWLPGA